LESSGKGIKKKSRGEGRRNERGETSRERRICIQFLPFTTENGGHDDGPNF